MTPEIYVMAGTGLGIAMAAMAVSARLRLGKLGVQPDTKAGMTVLLQTRVLLWLGVGTAFLVPKAVQAQNGLVITENQLVPVLIGGLVGFALGMRFPAAPGLRQ